MRDTVKNMEPRPAPAIARIGDQLYLRLTRLIECGTFPEGGRLPAEIELADRFGVSRPVVREVLSRLREAGVIVSRKGSGSFVQRRGDMATKAAMPIAGFGPVSHLAQVRKCYEFRLSIEGDAAYFAAANRSSEQLAAIREALTRIEEMIAQRAVGAEADYGFHLAVARASGNEFFEAVLQALRAPIEFAINLSRSLSLTRPTEQLRVIHGEHIAVAEAIGARDADAARSAMRLHIANTCSRVFEGSN